MLSFCHNTRVSQTDRRTESQSQYRAYASQSHGKNGKNGHFAFLDSLWGGLEAGYDVHLRLIGKRVVDFLLVIIELFSLALTLVELRANIDWKAPFRRGWVT